MDTCLNVDLDVPHLLRTVAVRASGVLHLATVVLALLTVTAPAALATTGSPMPWDTPLQNLLSNLTGPTARSLIVIAIVACGLLWAFTRNEEGLKRLGQVAFGGAIAMGAVVMLGSLGFTGAVL
jgi:type IV secretion system protein VirB2